MPIEIVPLSKIIRDPMTQARVAINNERVTELTDAYQRDEQIDPPVLMTKDGERFYVCDGNHRICALVNLEVVEWECEVRKGGQEDAFIQNCVLNGGPRGLPMNRADKRKAAKMAIDRWGSTMSDREIAAKLNNTISHATISDVRKEMGLESPAPTNRKTKPAPKEDVSNLTHTPPASTGYKGNPPAKGKEQKDDEIVVGESDLGEYASVKQSDGRSDDAVVVTIAPEIVKSDTKNETRLILDELRLAIGKGIGLGLAARGRERIRGDSPMPSY
jgi:hypothetical protein